MKYFILGRGESKRVINNLVQHEEEVLDSIDFIRNNPFLTETAVSMVTADRRLNELLGSNYTLAHQGHFLHPNLKDFHFFLLEENKESLNRLTKKAFALVWRDQIEIDPKYYPSMLDGCQRLPEQL